MGRWSWWAACVVWMMAAAGAWGQQAAGEAGPMGLPVLRRSVEVYGDLLGLSAEQREQAALLHDGYRAAYAANRKATDAAMREVWEKRREADGHLDARRETNALVNTYVQKAEELERAFFDDLRAILTPGQGERFVRVERARRREIGFRFAFSAGAGVDVLAVADAAKVVREGEVGAALERYEEDVDRVLTDRIAVLRGVFQKAKAHEDIEDDPVQMQQLVADLFHAGFRVRDVNRRAVREIAPLLDEATRTAFEGEFRRRALPKVYGPGAAEKTAAAIREKGRLTGEKAEELERLWKAYERDAAGINARLASEVEAREVAFTTRFMELVDDHHRDEAPGTNPLRDAWRARRDLDEAFVKAARELVPAGERGEIPRAKPMEYDDVSEPDLDADERATWEDAPEE